MTSKSFFCVDCGVAIAALPNKKRCTPCAKDRTKFLQKKYSATYRPKWNAEHPEYMSKYMKKYRAEGKA